MLKKLVAVIEKAEKALEDTKISEDGTDVKTFEDWATAENAKTLKDAIKVAKEAKAGTFAAEKTTLENALKTFNDATKPGTLK